MFPTPTAKGTTNTYTPQAVAKVRDAGLITNEEASALVPTGHEQIRKGLGLELKPMKRVNPTFVEWMMGYPQDWTNPDPSIQVKPKKPWSGVWPNTIKTREKTDPRRLRWLGNSWVPQVAWVAFKNLQAKLQTLTKEYET